MISSLKLFQVHGYADYALAYPKLVKSWTDAGGAVYAHEHMYHGKGKFDAKTITSYQNV